MILQHIDISKLKKRMHNSQNQETIITDSFVKYTSKIVKTIYLLLNQQITIEYIA